DDERDGVVLDQASGRVVAQSPVFGRFTSEGVLEAPDLDLEKDDYTYRWRPFGQGAPKQASMSLAGLDRSRGDDGNALATALDAALVNVYPSGSSRTDMTLNVLVTPWGSSDTSRIPIDLPHINTLYVTYVEPFDGPSVRQAPGSLVV